MDMAIGSVMGSIVNNLRNPGYQGCVLQLGTINSTEESGGR